MRKKSDFRIVNRGAIWYLEGEFGKDTWYVLNHSGRVTGGLEAPATFRSKEDTEKFLESVIQEPKYYYFD